MIIIIFSVFKIVWTLGSHWFDVGVKFIVNHMNGLK